MFRNDAQRSAAARVLLRSVRQEHLWDERPTPLALRLFERDGGYLSSGERMMLFIAWEVWDAGASDGKAGVGQCMAKLDYPQLRLLGSFFTAFSGGAIAIDRWLVEHKACAPLDGSVKEVEHVSE